MTETNAHSGKEENFEPEPNFAVQDADFEAWDKWAAPVRAPAASSADAKNETLETLIARVMQQDELAFAALYERLSGPVYSLALQISRNVACAEEVLQDVFWQVWRQAPRFDVARGSVPAWVLTITRSRALDAARSRMRAPQTQLSAQDEIDDYLPSPDAGPQDLLFAAQQGSRLKAALEGLDPLRRQLVSLSFYRDLTHQEISEQTGLPLGTVKSHLRRSVAALREALGADVARALS
jgi:RNA polymerase sigma-70 factor (ECF subfamily)